ncbi:MAG: NUDIX hydrolase [bacterium]|nr:NUDIX hydrolase [bacterium]
MTTSILLQVGVKVFLRNEEGKYLLLKRSPVRYPGIKNGWDIPGGRILPGTSLVENIKREVFEETQLPVLDEPRLIGAQDIIRLPEKHIVRLTFCATTSGTPALDVEHLEYKWMSLGDMKNHKELDEFTREILENDFSKIM